MVPSGWSPLRVAHFRENPHCDLVWVLINEVIWKLASTGESIDTPTSHGQCNGYRTQKALAWLVGLGSGQWLARCSNRSAGPMAIGKKVAMAMALDPGIGKPVSNPVDRLSRLQACWLDVDAESVG